MAFALNNRAGRQRYRPLAEINVTPLVDVMLVLLIIFMVTAPLMTSGVSVDLPKTNAQQINSDSQPLTVSVNAQGDIFLQNEPVDLAQLVAKLQAISQNNPDRRIFVRGDKDLAYGRIMQVMGTITLGGFTKVALLAQQTGLPPAPAPSAAAAPGSPAAAGTAPGTAPGTTAAPAATPAAPAAAPSAAPANKPG